jgi:hypothetical protein
MSRVTRDQVARLAGTSTAVVSYVINDGPLSQSVGWTAADTELATSYAHAAAFQSPTTFRPK